MRARQQFLRLYASRVTPAWRSILAAPFLALIYLYRFTLGPWIGGHCRFTPSCSQYALDAYRAHNPLRATALTARRLARCHPRGGHGNDPVPPAPNSTPRSRPLRADGQK